MWQQWKQGFGSWEAATSRYLEKVLANPLMVAPAAALLGGITQSKLRLDNATARIWSAVGLPTRRDQERILHKLNQLESKLLDLEEQTLPLTDQRRTSVIGANGAVGNGQ